MHTSTYKIVNFTDLPYYVLQNYNQMNSELFGEYRGYFTLPPGLSSYD